MTMTCNYKMINANGNMDLDMSVLISYDLADKILI
jgi:hypothetical protein